ncbi:MAG: MFS transporter [Clostridiales bacterium]|jgi:Na+/melibiose symporter-like transporter|nr:MFS transporter [Clostridiales bacterium]
MSEKTQRRKKLLKKGWEVGSYATGYALGGGVGQVLTLYYMSFLMFAMQIDPLSAALILGVTKVWDGFIDPAIGVLVDKTKSRFGSCRKWILISIVPIFITYFMLWYNFGITSTSGKIAYFLIAQLLFSTASSLGTVPYEALLPRMVDGYKERINYSSFRTVFSGIANVASTYIYAALIHAKEPDDYLLYQKEFAIMGLVLGAMFAIPMLITFLGSKEKIINTKPENLSVKGVFKDYAEILKSKLFRKCFLLSMLGSFISYAASIALTIFVLLTYSDLDVKIIGITLSLIFLVVNIKGAFEIGFFVPNIVMMKKRNKHFPFLVDLPILVAGCIILLFTTPETHLAVFFIGIALFGAGTSCLSFVPNVLMPDLPDIDELMYGKRREGANGGLVTLGRQVTSGLAFLIFGVVLTLLNLNEDNASTAQYTPQNIAALKIMLCAIPIIGGAVMFFISRTYNLDDKSHALIKAKIAEKREKGSVDFSKDERVLLEKITGTEYNRLWIAKEDVVQTAIE